MEPNSPDSPSKSLKETPSLLSAARRSTSPTKRPFGSGHVSPVRPRSPQKSPRAGGSPIKQNNDLRSHFMTTTSVTASPTKKAVQDADKVLSSMSGVSQEESAAARSSGTGGGLANFQKDAQSMMAAYSESAKDMMKSHVIDPAPIQKQPSGQSLTNRTTSSASSMSSGKRDLDLKHNDNTFHVLADLVVAYFVDPNSSSDLDSIVPQSARHGFVEAVRFRLKHNCPPDSEAQIHVLTRQCRELGLDKEGTSNPLFAASAATAAAAATPAGFANAPNSGRPPAGSSKAHPIVQPLPPQHIAARDDTSVAGSVLTATSVTEAHVSATESLARQQLMAELRDASKFMAESKTPDAAKFWKDHVVKLQARLRALHGDAPTNSSGGSVASAEEVLQNNRRLLGEQQRQDFMPSSPARLHQVRSVATPTYVPPASLDHTADKYQDPYPQTAAVNASRSMETVNMTPDTVDVVAPADLPAGYTFEAQIDGKRFLATVPAGGVSKGETFSSVMKDINSSQYGAFPRGEWRDRLFDCNAYGACHAHVLNGCVCPLPALGQVMSRTGLDFLGRPSRKGSRKAYASMWTIVVTWLTLNALLFGAYNLKWSRGIELTHADWLSLLIVNAAMLFFGFYVTTNTRAALRTKFHIPEKRCYDLEDFYCGTFCMPCSICQMLRHTADYDNYDAECCSKFGVTPEATGLDSKGRRIV